MPEPTPEQGDYIIANPECLDTILSIDPTIQIQIKPLSDIQNLDNYFERTILIKKPELSEFIHSLLVNSPESLLIKSINFNNNNDVLIQIHQSFNLGS